VPESDLLWGKGNSSSAESTSKQEWGGGRVGVRGMGGVIGGVSVSRHRK